MRNSVAVGSAASVLILAASALLGPGAARAQQKTEFVWGAPTVASSYYWDVLAAIELGYMDAENLSIKIVNNDTPVQSIQFLAAGAIAMSSINTEVGLSAMQKGADFKFIGSEDDKIAFVLMARPEIKAYADLRGKTLGVTAIQESTATMIRLLLDKNGVKANEYQAMALGGSPNRYAALVRGAVSATMLSPPFDYKAQADGMNRLGNAFDAFTGVGVAFAVQNEWAKTHADALVRFLRGAAKGAKFLYDTSNKAKAVEILVKYTKSPADDLAKSYDSFYSTDKIMSRDLELTDKLLQPWLDLSGSSDKPAKYIDLSYWKQALGR
jgi:ABC-type nitrate/sulfonate/bicarbonate transport system substrate-binding protein